MTVCWGLYFMLVDVTNMHVAVVYHRSHTQLSQIRQDLLLIKIKFIACCRYHHYQEHTHKHSYTKHNKRHSESDSEIVTSPIITLNTNCSFACSLLRSSLNFVSIAVAAVVDDYSFTSFQWQNVCYCCSPPYCHSYYLFIMDFYFFPRSGDPVSFSSHARS